MSKRENLSTSTSDLATEPGPDIFLSYRINPDQAFAQCLKNLFEAAIRPKPRVFVASLGGVMPSATSLNRQIQTAARSSGAFVGVISPDSLGREWIIFEAGSAWGQNKLYAPVIFGIEHDDMPQTISSYLATRPAEEAEMETLLKSLAGALGRRRSPQWRRSYASFLRELDRLNRPPPATEDADMAKDPLFHATNLSLVGREIRNRIHDILWNVWDPIHINSEAPEDEYDSYIDGIYQLLSANCSEGQLRNHLQNIETTLMGLPTRDSRHIQPTVQELLAVSASLWMFQHHISPEDIIEIVERFLHFLRSNRKTQSKDALYLLQFLDHLAIARHSISYRFDDCDHPEPPEWPYNDRRELAANRFPDFGAYNVVQSITTDVGCSRVAVGDPLDDIADIAGDLYEFSWAWRNTTKDNALWHYANSFDMHWGKHLRDLQLYLHCNRIGS